MAYSERIKNFARIRDIMRQFYVYGFQTRAEYTQKSARTYDDERRRVESWLGDLMRFRRTAEGKQVFLSIDSRACAHNPLYAAWKTKSFTDGDITLHFLIFDILNSEQIELTLDEIVTQIDENLRLFANARLFDRSTIRKKLGEYAALGMIKIGRRGRLATYRRAPMRQTGTGDALDFFSETAPCGVVGSYLLDRLPEHESPFVFKHHYMTAALDSEILCTLFLAMRDKRYVTLDVFRKKKKQTVEKRALPLRILVSVQSGRQYLAAYLPREKRITTLRIDLIASVEPAQVCAQYDEYRERLDAMRRHMWGVSTQGDSGRRLACVSFTVRYADDETFIHRRLEREKRCGTVERLDANTSRFTAQVYDAKELVPWIRTFLCRITELSFSEPELQRQFWEDVEETARLYGAENVEGTEGIEERKKGGAR